MIDENAEGATRRFEEKFRAGGFTIALSPNTEADYTATKQDRDTKAVQDFIGTDLFNEIMGKK
ncbi:hypothetical protein AGMMS4952_17860 [Spirochaetia bacterium]|nr:hypothetical protein AGMMS4952_17860 [Spirochaetia bacterium]